MHTGEFGADMGKYMRQLPVPHGNKKTTVILGDPSGCLLTAVSQLRFICSGILLRTYTNGQIMHYGRKVLGIQGNQTAAK